jgi:hypothetical protein
VKAVICSTQSLAGNTRFQQMIENMAKILVILRLPRGLQ